VSYKNISFTVWVRDQYSKFESLGSHWPKIKDVGGQDKIRPLWKHYFSGSQGIIYVVDSNDRDRIEEASETLFKMLKSEELQDIPLLVLANKQDLPSALKISDLTDQMELHTLRNRKWYVQATCGTTGEGLYEGLDWLSRAVTGRGSW